VSNFDPKLIGANMGIEWAWQTSEEDVAHVLRAMGETADLSTAERILGTLDRTAIAKAALHGDDMDAQTEAAHLEIERQLRDQGFGAPGPRI
jgi:hypothetical protein